jgi:catalase
VIGGAAAGVVVAFGYVGGWLAPARLTPHRLVDALQTAGGGVHPGFRRNHAKGVCVTGYFEGSGAASAYSVAPFFKPVRTPVVGRFALPAAIRMRRTAACRSGLALKLTAPDGEQWRTGMNAMRCYGRDAEGVHEQLLATAPDPATGKPDPRR